MATFVGVRTGLRPADGPVVRVTVDGRLLTHYALRSVVFAWGFAGTPALDLAFSILVEHFHEVPEMTPAGAAFPPSSRAYGLAERFMHDHVAMWGDEWVISDEQIDRWVARLAGRRPDRGSFDAIA